MPPDRFLNNVAFFLPLIMMLTWIVSVASMVRRLVYEREIQMEEVSCPGLAGSRLCWAPWSLRSLSRKSPSARTAAQ